MAETVLPNKGLKYEYTLGAGLWKPGLDANFVIQDTLGGQGNVLNDALLAEPGAPSVGDAYVLPTGTKTGTNWGSDAGAVTDAVALFTNIAGQPDSSPWLYLTPREGWLVYERTSNQFIHYNGSKWVIAMGRSVNKQTGTTYEPVLADADGVIPINNATHTFNLPDNATVPFPVGTRLTIPNQNAAAITVTDDVAVSYATGSQDFVSAGIAANAVAEIVKTATDEWLVLRNEALPT